MKGRSKLQQAEFFKSGLLLIDTVSVYDSPRKYRTPSGKLTNRHDNSPSEIPRNTIKTVGFFSQLCLVYWTLFSKTSPGTTCWISTAYSSETSFAIISLDGQLNRFFSARNSFNSGFFWWPRCPVVGVVGNCPAVVVVGVLWFGMILPPSILVPETLAREKSSQKKTLDVFKISTRLKHLQGDFMYSYYVYHLINSTFYWTFASWSRKYIHLQILPASCWKCYVSSLECNFRCPPPPCRTLAPVTTGSPRNQPQLMNATIAGKGRAFSCIGNETKKRVTAEPPWKLPSRLGVHEIHLTFGA